MALQAFVHCSGMLAQLIIASSTVNSLAPSTLAQLMMAHSVEDIQRAVEVAKEKLGLDYQLKEKQFAAISNFVRGHDTFVILPTGYAKSLCYTVLPFLFDALRGRKGSIVVCVSALVALMMDQQVKLRSRGLRAEYVEDELSDAKGVQEGKVELVLISPEALLTNLKCRDMLRSTPYQENLVAFVVDEAHCVKKW